MSSMKERIQFIQMCACQPVNGTLYNLRGTNSEADLDIMSLECNVLLDVQHLEGRTVLQFITLKHQKELSDTLKSFQEKLLSRGDTLGSSLCKALSTASGNALWGGVNLKNANVLSINWSV